MKNQKPKIIVIVGQTATGKSDFAVQIAKKVHGEIISADSRQVYKGMNLGTGKITKKEMQGIPHHLLDVATPSKVFSVSDFKKLADKKITEILKRDHVPIIVGGTGFYIDAVVNDITLPQVPPNKKLRANLVKKSPEQLFKMLQKLDSARAKTIDSKNPVRLIRAIEIATALGVVPTLSPKQGFGLEKYDALKIGLILPDEVLKKNICTRLLARIKKPARPNGRSGGGMLKEIQKLHDKGLSWKRMEELGLEYRYGAFYLQGNEYKKKNDLAPSLASDWVKKLNTEIWHYAKRQMTWFKRDKKIIWIDPRKEKTKAFKEVKKFLK